MSPNVVTSDRRLLLMAPAAMRAFALGAPSGDLDGRLSRDAERANHHTY